MTSDRSEDTSEDLSKQKLEEKYEPELRISQGHNDAGTSTVEPEGTGNLELEQPLRHHPIYNRYTLAIPRITGIIPDGLMLQAPFVPHG
jgi:hypothetical protein